MKKDDLRFIFDSVLLSSDEISETTKSLETYVAHLQDVRIHKKYDEPESSICLVSDEELIDEVETLVKKKVTEKLKYVIDIGIGGSSLGTAAVYEAVKRGCPGILFADTVNPVRINRILKVIEHNCESPDEFLITVVSKSGKTTEVIANAEVILDALIQKFGNDVMERVVVISDEGSGLWNAALDKKLDILVIPKMVGGRYSLFSAVSLFPLACVGVDIRALQKGAERMRDRCLTYANDNPALISAVVLYIYNQKNIRINNNFYFNTELESLGKWYRQLMGESLGKGKNEHGDAIHAGITPTVAMGSVDLHSMAQLYLGGPHDKLTTFLYAENNQEGLVIPTRPLFPGLVEGISGRDITHIMDAIYGGAVAAYKKNNIPFTEILFDEIKEDSIGQYLQMKMIEMMYLAKLLRINAFDQPKVEDYKSETRKILGSQDL